jgi:hypothetical protein
LKRIRTIAGTIFTLAFAALMAAAHHYWRLFGQ